MEPAEGPARTDILGQVDHGIKPRRTLLRARKRAEPPSQGPTRVIQLNGDNTDPLFTSNEVVTSKYTMWTFLPLSLFEQFTRLANAFFLLVAVLVWFPIISPVQPYGPVAALSFLLAVTLIREAVEDIRRHRDDFTLNHSAACRLSARDASFDTHCAWQDIRVGDVVRCVEGDLLPCDLLVINSSEPNGTCYVSTMQLDGETNAKAKQAPGALHHVHDAAALAALRGTIEAEGWNKRLDHFDGTLVTSSGERVALDNRCMMYRGSKLVNTKWIFGVAIFTGNQTKIMKNNIRGRFKQSALEGTLNTIIIAIFVVLFAIMLFGGIVAASNVNKYETWAFLFWDRSGFVNGLINFFTFFILFAGMVPISLYVYLELVKTAHVLWIDWDVEMYHAESDTRANAKSSLSDDLGMVSYIMSDKTGTLTRNEMVYSAASIAGVQYGKEPTQDVAFAAMPVEAQAFFKLLALCHTVLVEALPNGELRYNAESPDEAALVSAGAKFGFRLVSRETTSHGSFLTLEEGPALEQHRYQLLNVLGFTSERKRMTVVVRDLGDERIYVLCKGADSVVQALLSPGQEALLATTMGHLDGYATQGLRTLMVGMRELEADAYVEWNARYVTASTSVEGRLQAVEAVSLELERDLRLLGASAIEDKLQEGVPEAIGRLTAAGIKVWVLTGDRKDTAINIGFASRLLLPSYKLIVIDAAEWHQTQLQLKDALDNYLRPKPSSRVALLRPSLESQPAYALIIEGKTLRHALEPENRLHLLALANLCTTVVCCRVEPKQKAEVVALVKNTLGKVVLSVGDGANDVPMIKEAHVGVGICGKEGRQAVMSADYALGQFAFLTNLLLVHGRWAYKRVVMVVLWSFYKSIVFAFTNVWFEIYSSASGQTLFESWTLGMYHVLFTSLPILVFGMFDQDVARRTAQSYPQLYEAGRLGEDLNMLVFIRWAVTAILDSLLCFFATYLSFAESTIDPAGFTYGLWSFGLQIYSAVVLITNGRLALQVGRWTWPMAVSFGLSVFLFYGFTLMLGATSLSSRDASMYMVAQNLFSTANYWFTLFWTVIVALLSELLWNVVRRFFFPENVHVAQYIAYREKREQRERGVGGGQVKVLEMARVQEGLDPEIPYQTFVSPWSDEHARSTLRLAEGVAPDSPFVNSAKLRISKGRGKQSRAYLMFDDEEGDGML